MDIDIDGTRHFFWVDGQERPGRVPLVFIHGWCGSSRYWEPVAQACAKRTLCLRYDLRGMGMSRLGADSSQDFSLTAYARELAQLLDHLDIGRIDLNAHSMGASIGMAFANLYPERVRRLVLTCTGIFEYQWLPFETFYLASHLVIAVRPGWMVRFKIARDAFQRRFVHKLLEDGWARLFVEDYVAASSAAARGTLTSSIGKHATGELPRNFKDLQMPTLLISGEHDQIIPAAGARRAIQVNPQLELEILPGTGHFPMLEAPTSYLAVLERFLTQEGR